MRSPILKWACGTTAILGFPLGVLVALSSGSLLAGLAGTMAVILVVSIACRKDLIREYNQKSACKTNNRNNTD